MAGTRPAKRRNTHLRRTAMKAVQGFSLVEALVASFLLMFTVSQSLRVFSTTMDTIGKSRLRDSLNAAIHADLEEVRNEVADWATDTSREGMTRYMAWPGQNATSSEIER